MLLVLIIYSIISLLNKDKIFDEINTFLFGKNKQLIISLNNS